MAAVLSEIKVAAAGAPAIVAQKPHKVGGSGGVFGQPVAEQSGAG